LEVTAEDHISEESLTYWNDSGDVPPLMMREMNQTIKEEIF
jgi:hypothetical protein